MVLTVVFLHMTGVLVTLINVEFCIAHRIRHICKRKHGFVYFATMKRLI